MALCPTAQPAGLRCFVSSPMRALKGCRLTAGLPIALTHINAGAADIILSGPLDDFKGGFTGVMKTAHICESYGMMCAIHGGSIASLHAASAIYNTKYFERLVPETYYAPPGIKDASTEIDSEGYAQPWNEPGLGIHVDWAWMDKHTVGIEE